MQTLNTRKPLVVPKAVEMRIKVIKTSQEVQEFIKAKIRAGGAEALMSMMEGNERHVNKATKHNSDRKLKEAERFVTDGQKPFVTLLSCADSRVKASRVFDKKDGRIFNVKNAGNIAYDPVTLGSLEYGVKHLHTPILMVMGHEFCGAVSAACTHKGHVDEGHISHIIEKIGQTAIKTDYDKEASILLNVLDTIEQIRAQSPIIAGHEKDGKVDIVAAYYSIGTGHVALLEQE